jgi:anti-sigma regulatory factor (Ser/Thr protein kinase)
MPLQPRPRAAWVALYPVEATSSKAARETTRWFLGNCNLTDDAIETAVLVVSELVTNAYKAMQGQAIGLACIDLSLRLFPTRLLIEVTDSSPLSPVLSESDFRAEGGRGLTAVDALSDSKWGFYWQQGRKIVYAILEPIDTRAATPNLEGLRTPRGATLAKPWPDAAHPKGTTLGSYGGGSPWLAPPPLARAGRCQPQTPRAGLTTA